MLPAKIEGCGTVSFMVNYALTAPGIDNLYLADGGVSKAQF
ncbi:hypothetical protein [Pedobacter sp. L105]|nr:hypothetical protein [Pedobacter sp. L105]